MKKLIAGLALTAFSMMAQAAPLVINGDFENGLTGWAEDVAPGATANQHGVTTFSSSDLNKFYSVGSTGLTSLSQSLNTAAGTLYDLSFQLRGVNDANAPELPENYSKVVFGNYSYMPISFDGGSFTTFVYKGLLAAAGPTTLTFTASSKLSYVHLDNVSVQVSAVPEPETYAMMLLGLGLIGYAMQRRRKG